MKNIAVGLLALAIAASGAQAASVSATVTVGDLAAAGVPGAAALAPDHDRFKPPVAYFRITEKLSLVAAKADCADCADLVAVYTAVVSVPPDWAAVPNAQLVKMGGRWQVRAYLAKQKRVVTVTAPGEAAARAISSALAGKFSK